jgi:hypothetical protein
MTVQEVAAKLETSLSSVYNMRNGYFRPGLQLAVRIAELSTKGRRCAVPVSYWTDSPIRPRRAAE